MDEGCLNCRRNSPENFDDLSKSSNRFSNDCRPSSFHSDGANIERKPHPSKFASSFSVKEAELSPYELSEEAKEALDHPISPYYFLAPGCVKNTSKDSINAFTDRRLLKTFSSCREKSTSNETFPEFDGSPCRVPRRGRTMDRETSYSTPVSRTGSLDRSFSRTKSNNQIDQAEFESSFTDQRRPSVESVASSQMTVDNFERNLVSKIVERFEMEDEFPGFQKRTPFDSVRGVRDNSTADISERTSEHDDKPMIADDDRPTIDDDGPIIVTVTSQERLDPSHIDSISLPENLRITHGSSKYSKSMDVTNENSSDKMIHKQHEQSYNEVTWHPRVSLSSRKDSDTIPDHLKKSRDCSPM